MLPRVSSSIVAFALVFMMMSSIQAGMYSVHMTWTSDPVTGEGFTDQIFSGSATFTYDTRDFELLPSGFSIGRGSLSSFTQSPDTIGSTFFDASNTVFRVAYFQGTLRSIVIGGGPTADSMNSIRDDFYVTDTLFNPDPSLDGFGVTIADTSEFVRDVAIRVTTTVTPIAVPEPTSGLLWSMGVAALAILRRRKP